MAPSLFFLSLRVIPTRSDRFGTVRNGPTQLVRHMNESPLYDDELEAARATVKALGGAKKVGPIFWPEKTPENAGRYMHDCLNAGRSERLTPAQVLLLMRMGREVGAHALAEHFMAEAGYQRPIPINPQAEATVLAHQIDSVFDRAAGLLDRLERIRKMGVPI